MPSFPASVKTFVTRNTGDVIAANHINDLQDETNALEAGYLNGTARLNSSASTLASLGVTGPSTFSSNVTITGGLQSSNCTVSGGFQSSNSTISGGLNSSNSTLANLSVTGGSTLGTLQAGASTHTSLSVSGNSTVVALTAGASTLTSLSVSGGSTLATLQAAGSTFSVRPITPPPDCALVFMETAIIMGSSNLSTVSFQGQTIAINSSIHSTGTNPERLTPQSTGLYRVTAQVRFTSTEAGQRGIHLTDSSGGDFVEVQHTASSRSNFIQAVGYKRFDAIGGYVICRAEQVGASTMTLSTGAAGTWFALEKM